jgi:hypothetical protein
MKKNIFICLLTVVGGSLLMIACNKSIEGRTDNLSFLSPSNIDGNAGSWKLILLSRPDSFLVAPPAATNTPGYIGELNEIKGLQQNLTSDQINNIKYWSAGAVLRWNETMRELVSKYNLAPYQKEDGTYPAPSAANPFAYPQFPFANPPFASRAYAYVAAAQYDALVACWYYKTLYNRAAPYKTDSMINVNAKYISKTDLPSYPSEDAVLAGVTAELMKLFFPTEIAFVEQKAADEEASSLASGKNTRSDWTAGEALGRQIATVFAARGRTDKAGAAGGTPAIWAQMEQDCIGKGEVPWISQEVPKRPPQLPLFGKVKTFLFDSATLVNAVRPGPPPSTSSQQFKDETAEVKYYTENVTRERMRIIDFWADGVATPTPPGHWNDIAAGDFLMQNYSEVRWARNFALLNMAMMDAAIACWDAKFTYFNPRPSQVDPEIKTLTGLPNFPSYISGHSTFSAAAATILGHLIPSRAAAYNSMAQEAEMSRLYGGIHYRSDIEVGYTVGQKVGDYAVQRARSDGGE